MTDAAKTAPQGDDAALERFVHADRTETLEAGPGLKRQLLGYGPQIMGAHVWFETGAVGQMHAHHHAQIAYVVSGRFKVTIEDETRTLVAGDSFYVPPHAMHGAVCEEAGELIDVFSPWREDFIGLSEDAY